jgi:predicted membrane-bound spermidine synthase
MHLTALEIRHLAVITTLLTGATGLIYEVTWQRYLGNLLGSQAQASSLILSVFLGGLAVGYGIFGTLSRKQSPGELLRLCGLLELGIGGWAFFFPSIYKLVWNIAGLGVTFFIKDFFVTVALLGIPTMLMGGTLPLLTQGLSFSRQESSKVHAIIYSANTGGAFVGCLTAGFLLIPCFGLPFTMMGASLVNVVAGLLFLIISKKVNKYPTTNVATKSDGNLGSNQNFRSSSLYVGIAIAFIAGFYSLCLQTVFIRMFGISVGSSEYSFSIIVSVFILMLAIGAASLATKSTREPRLWLNQLILLLSLFMIGGLIEYAPYGAHVIRIAFSNSGVAFYAYHLALMIAVFALLLIPVGAMGRTMPLLFSAVKGDFSGLGSDVGILYGWNSIGCVCGTTLGGYVLLYVINLDSIYKICLELVALTIVLSIPSLWTNQQRRCFVCLGFIVVSGAVWVLPSWNTLLLSTSFFRVQQETDVSYKGALGMATAKGPLPNVSVIAYKDDPMTSVAVKKESAQDGRDYMYSIIVNAKSDGATAGTDRVTTLLLAHLPALLYSGGTVTNAAVIGLGTGITAGALASYKSVKTVTTYEISPFVIKFLHLFDFANGKLSQNREVSIVQGDAYRMLAGSTERFGIIVSEPSNPWVTGVDRVFSEEFYSLVRSRLSDDGVYSQWFHIYSIGEETFGLVLNTFGRAFEHTIVFSNGVDIILLGSRKPFELNTLLKNIESESEAFESLRNAGFSDASSVIARELSLSPHTFSRYGVHTLEFPKLSFMGGKDFFAGRQTDLVKLTHQPVAKRIVAKNSTDSLRMQWYQNGGSERGLADQQFLFWCQRNRIEVFPGWFESNAECREAIVRLVIGGTLSPNGSMSNSDIEFLKSARRDVAFYPNSIELKELTERPTLIFKNLNSASFRLDVTRVMSVASDCLSEPSNEGRRCRFELAEGVIEPEDIEIVNRYFSDLRRRKIIDDKEQYVLSAKLKLDG